jgi:hypothetical protein
MGRKSKKETDKKKPGLHKELEGFSIDINEFGEIITSKPLDHLNEFLNKHVEDKKFKKEESASATPSAPFPET